MTNVLFLADRTALVKQAKDDFKKYLPDQSLCNLCSSKDDKAARIVFSTYPTMLNAIDNAKTKDGVPLFSPAHFDLIIVDESHHARSELSLEMLENFNPCFVLDLTATPKKESNIISYVDAVQLKNEHMVKLPVIVYNRDSQSEVLIDAIDLRNKLEEIANAEYAKTGKYLSLIHI